MLEDESGLYEIAKFCDINSVQDWFHYEFMYLARGNILYKQFKNCGRFFIPSHRSDSKYGQRMDAASGKTCKEVSASNTFAKDEIHQVYTKAYHRMDSRKRTMYISKKELPFQRLCHRDRIMLISV